MEDDKKKTTNEAAPEKPATVEEPKTEKVEKTEKTTTEAKSEATPVKSNSNKNLWLAIGAAIAAVVIIVAVILVIALGKKGDDGEVANKGDSSQTEDKDDEKDESEVKELNKSLTVENLTMKYSSDWKTDTNTTNEKSIYKGDDQYLMLDYTSGSGTKFSTEEYAEVFLSAFDDEDKYEVRQKPTDIKIGGKNWKSAVVYSEGVWMTMYFYADGDDYYLATYGSTKSSKIPAEAKAMLDTLTVK